METPSDEFCRLRHLGGATDATDALRADYDRAWI
jgi:hypothetical protein